MIRLPDERVCCRLSAFVERTVGVTARCVSLLALRADGAADRVVGLDETEGRNDGRAPNEDIRGAPPKCGPPPKCGAPVKCAAPPKCGPPPKCAPPPPRANATSMRAIDVIPTRVSNVNCFISQDRYSLVQSPWCVRGILDCYLRVAAGSLFRVRASREGPEHCDQSGQYRHPWKDEILPAGAVSWGMISTPTRGSEDKTQTIRMVIKN
jgi:hypothetical protein